MSQHHREKQFRFGNHNFRTSERESGDADKIDVRGLVETEAP